MDGVFPGCQLRVRDVVEIVESPAIRAKSRIRRPSEFQLSMAREVLLHSLPVWRASSCLLFALFAREQFRLSALCMGFRPTKEQRYIVKIYIEARTTKFRDSSASAPKSHHQKLRYDSGLILSGATLDSNRVGISAGRPSLLAAVHRGALWLFATQAK